MRAKTMKGKRLSKANKITTANVPEEKSTEAPVIIKAFGADEPRYPLHDYLFSLLIRLDKLKPISSEEVLQRASAYERLADYAFAHRAYITADFAHGSLLSTLRELLDEKSDDDGLRVRLAALLERRADYCVVWGHYEQAFASYEEAQRLRVPANAGAAQAAEALQGKLHALDIIWSVRSQAIESAISASKKIESNETIVDQLLKEIELELPNELGDMSTSESKENLRSRLIRQLLDIEGVVVGRPGIAAEISEVLARAKGEVQSPSGRDRGPRLKPPVPELSSRQISALIAFGKSHPWGKRGSDPRTPFEWIRDHYTTWIPGLLQNHLRKADPMLCQALQQRIHRNAEQVPDWFDVPTKKENRIRAAKPKDRDAIQQARRLDRESKRLKARLG